MHHKEDTYKSCFFFIIIWVEYLNSDHILISFENVAEMCFCVAVYGC